jgi:hypothetical protein
MKLNLGLKSAIALATGIFITFMQIHDQVIGLIALTALALGWATSNLLAIFLAKNRISVLESVPLIVIQAIFGVIALNSELTLLQEPDSQILQFSPLLILVITWGFLSGAYDVWQAQLVGAKTGHGRDYLISAGLNFVLAAIFLIPGLDIVSAVGFLGAYSVLMGVHLGIWAATPAGSKNQR